MSAKRMLSRAALTDGRLYCWGWNNAGQLGDGTTIDRHAPVQTSVGTTLQVSAGVNQNSCANLSDGTIWCWGSDSLGQVGDGGGVTRTAPVKVLAAAPASSVPATPRWARLGLALLLVLVAWLGRRRWSSNALAATALALGVAAASGCADQRAPGTPAPTAGSIQLALTIPPSVQIGTVTYQITRGTYSQSGSIDVSHTSVITGVVGGIPIGTGYQLALSASDPSGKLTGCSGTASFDVSGGMATNVPIDVVCHVTPTPPPPPPPSVPIPYPAVVVLAGALLGAGLGGGGRSRR
ncbi:MAG TPA: hypothetical protein VMT03_16820 [Polyangia bacterium]|nr:hypothetical protein [Polyangia bacterium]